MLFRRFNGGCYKIRCINESRDTGCNINQNIFYSKFECRTRFLKHFEGLRNVQRRILQIAVTICSVETLQRRLAVANR